MKPRSFFYRLLFGNLLLVGAILILGAVFSYEYLNRQYRRDVSAGQDAFAELARRHFQQHWPMTAEQIDRECKALAPRSTYPFRLTVIAFDGKPLGDNLADPSKMENLQTFAHPDVNAALDGRPGEAVRQSNALDAECRFLTLPIAHEGRTVAAVSVAMPVRPTLAVADFVRNTVLWLVLAGVFLVLSLGMLVNLIWYAPLKQVTQIARRIAAGNLAHRASISGSEELSELGRSLNDMRDSLARQIDTIESQRESLETVVGNLREGVVATDKDGRIVLMNQAAREMLAADVPEVKSRRLQQVLRVAEVLDLYEVSLESGEPVGRQMELDVGGRRRTLDVHVSPVSTQRSRDIEALLVVRDISDMARAAAMKTEFVANASHELRTPLATIRAAVDSMDDLDLADRQGYERFVAILDRQVLRLENMTNDLLDLHIVETSRKQLKLETIELASVTDWARDHTADPAAKKGVGMVFRAEPEGFEFRSDRVLLQLILQNLLENAIKFTPPGGTVTFSCKQDRHGARFEVADTGCGIPHDAQKRVFERFFQVDSARSGDTRIRGTGLGLAIVKHASERLRGWVDLQSEPGKGAAVTVYVPDQDRLPQA